MDSFDRIIGYDNFKKDLRCLADMLKNTDRYKKLCADLPKSLLIFGEPGVGKTLAATSLLEESKRASYIIRKTKSTDNFIDYIHNTFEEALNNQPSIVLLDDLDKFAEGDEDTYNDDVFIVIQSIIDELSDEDVFIVATANDISELPFSLRRAGRLGRQMHFDTPCNADALAIINYYIKTTKFKLDVPAELIARTMMGHSCAELKSVISEASLSAGYHKRKSINKDDIKDALLHGVLGVREAYGRTDDEATLKTIYHEAGHAIVALALGDDVNMISSVVSGTIGGFTLQADNWCDTNLVCDYDYNDYVKAGIIDLGGKAATELIYKTPDLGTTSDLDNARQNTEIAIALLGVNGFKYMRGLRITAGETLIQKEMIKQIERFYKIARNVISKNMDVLYAIRDKLLEQPVLLYDDIQDILKEHPIKPYNIKR